MAEPSAFTISRHTKALSADEFQGRKPSTSAEQPTIQYIAREMAAVGLRPGNGDSWFHKVPLVGVEAEPANLEISNAASTIKLEYGKDAVLWTDHAERAASISGSEIVFVGYGITAPERQWDDYAGVDVVGKTVLILVNEPDIDQPTGPFDGQAMTYYGRWTYKLEEAARRGAAAAILIHETVPAAYPWQVVVNGWTGNRLHADTPSDQTQQLQLAAWITAESAGRVTAAGGHSFSDLKAAASRRGFRAIPLKLSASASIRNTVVRAETNNVVGMIRGTTRPDEFIIFMAHWDHLGRCKADESGDDICNGAIDNASGVGGILAIAEAFSKERKPQRSIIFLSTTAEEAGLLGSRYFASSPTVPLSKIVAGFNLDVLNTLGRTRDFVVLGLGKSQLDDMFISEAARRGRVVVGDRSPEKGSYYRSDHFSLALVGVPMFTGDVGTQVLGRPEGYGPVKLNEYTSTKYHKPADEFSDDLDFNGAAEDTAIVYSVARRLADSASWPKWNESSEFKRARDASLSASGD